jgi:hypothetical protein
MALSPKPLVPLAAAALLAAGGGTYALASPTAATIAVCVKHHGGSLYENRKCARLDHRLSWNQQGPAGSRGAAGATGIQGPRDAAGVPGPQGPSGHAATRLFGYVHEGLNPNIGTANVVYGSGVMAVDDPAGASPYMVTFTQSIANCVIQAEPGVGNPSGGNNSLTPRPSRRSTLRPGATAASKSSSTIPAERQSTRRS